MVGDQPMRPDDVRARLDQLRSRLIQERVDARIHVIGGSAMALLFPDDPDVRVTRDIDAAIRPAPEVAKVVAAMAQEFGMSSRWLNANGAPFMPPGVSLDVVGHGVDITIASVEDMIAMKLAASRDQDLRDLGILARHAGIADAETLVDIAYAAYGEDSVVLSDSRDDYLQMAEQALVAARKH